MDHAIMMCYFYWVLFKRIRGKSSLDSELSNEYEWEDDWQLNTFLNYWFFKMSDCFWSDSTSDTTLLGWWNFISSINLCHVSSLIGNKQKFWKINICHDGGAETFLMEHMLTFRNFSNSPSTHLPEWKNKKAPWYFSKFSRKTPTPSFFQKNPVHQFTFTEDFLKTYDFLIRKYHVLFENFKNHPPTLWILLGISSIKKVPAPPIMRLDNTSRFHETSLQWPDQIY